MGCCSSDGDKGNLTSESFNSLIPSEKREKFLRFIEYLKNDDWKSHLLFLHFHSGQINSFEKAFSLNNLSVLSQDELFKLIEAFTEIFVFENGMWYLRYGTKIYGKYFQEKNRIVGYTVYASILNIFETFNNSISVFYIENLNPHILSDESKLLFLGKFREKLKLLKVFLPKLKRSIELKNLEIKKTTQEVKDEMINEKFSVSVIDSLI